MKVEIYKLKDPMKKVRYHTELAISTLKGTLEENILIISKKIDMPKTLVYRFGRSYVFKDKPIGSLKGEIIDDVMYIDPPDMTTSSGKTLVCTKDTWNVCLYLKEKPDEYIIINSISETLNDMGIPAKIMNNQDIILKGGKFACNAYREPDDDWRKLERAHITFYYDHEIFRKILPDIELYRETSRDKVNNQITGIENHYPDFDRNEFENLLIKKVAEKLGEKIKMV